MEGPNYPVIGALILAGLVAATIVAARFKGAILVLGGMLFASALTAPFDPHDRPVETWMLPLQNRRSEVFAACGALIMLAGLFHWPRLRVGRVPLMALCSLAIGLYASFVRTVAGGDVVEGGQSFVFALLTILPLALVLPSVLENRDDVMRVLRVMALVAIAWIIACAVQFVIRPKVLAMGGGYTRFQGMLGNPQHAGAFLAFCTTVAAFLMVNEAKARYRPIWALLAGMLTVLTIWTGSRTGLGMTAIGVASVFYSRFGRAVLFLPIVAAIVVAVLEMLRDVTQIDIERLTSGADTRTMAWMALIDQFLENPLFGTAMGESQLFSENSFLLALAGFGIGMGAIVFFFTVIAAFKCLGAIRARFSLLDPLDKRLADLFVGLTSMYFAGALLEGYMLSRVSAPLVFILFAAALGSYLAVRAREDRALEAVAAHPYEDAPALTESGEYDYSEYGDFSGYEEPQRG